MHGSQSSSAGTKEAELRALKLEKLRRLERLAEPLLDYIPRVSPRFLRPSHLAPLADVFERISRGEVVRALVDVPAQHGKSTLCTHAIPWLIQRHPTWPIIYSTYSQAQSYKKSNESRHAAIASGAMSEATDRLTMEDWRNAVGGGCLWTSVGGGTGGNPARVFIFDDFFEGRDDAESKHCRDGVVDWIESVAIPRIPADGSMVIPSTRWHEDDPSGRIQRGELCKGMGFEHISLPFLSRGGVADDDGDTVCWPRAQLSSGDWVGWTPELAKARLVAVGPYAAASIYQGQPRPRGGIVYAQPVRCTAPIIDGARFVLGCDPAGTDGPNSNHTVIVALAVRTIVEPPADGLPARLRTVADVAGVLRLKLRPEHAAPQVLAFQRQFGGTPLNIEATRDGRELGRELQKIEGALQIEYVAASGDKYLRAQAPSTAWNQGFIRVPADARTMRHTTDADLADFVRVTTAFAGMGDREDDDPDALAHAWTAAITPVVVRRTADVIEEHYDL